MNEYLKNLDWWRSLSPEWRQAFSMTVLLHNDQPSAADLQMLKNLQVLRVAGPSAPFSNCTIELTGLSGVTKLKNLQTLIVTHHKIQTIQMLAGLSRLTNLFLFNNQIKSLDGIEGLQHIEQLYVQHNLLVSIKPIEALLNLKEICISNNRITSLEGLTEAHSEKLKKFVCLPNELLKQKEIIYTERQLGIICR